MRFRSKVIWPFAFVVLILGTIAASLGMTPPAATSGLPFAADTPTFTPIAPLHLVISEFRTRGSSGDNDEFVELYNPTGAAVNIGGWTIKRSSDCGGSTYTLLTITYNTVINAGQHYLMLSTNSSLSGADQVFSPGLTDSGGLALVDLGGNVIDAVGMCNTTLYREGTNLSPLSGNINQSYERLPGGATACYDTNSNAGDFVLISPSTPLNKSAPIALCTGVVTYTPTRTPTITPTRTPTRTATTIPGFVIINEFLPHPHSDWNDDGQANVNDEYIELINLSTSPVNIQNWRLDNGDNTHAFLLPNISMLPRQILVFFRYETNIPLSDGGGTVRLVKADGHTADLFNYPPVEAEDRTWCRLFSGTGFLTFGCVPTPGRPNIAATPTPAASEPTPAVIENPQCNLADTVPAPFSSAECNNVGGDIGQLAPLVPLPLPGPRKWPAFIE